MSAAENLLSRLQGVKGRNGSWVARCPSHQDKSPSLAVRELDDGRVLLHCFAGCSTESVVSSVGLTIGDLFPPNEKRQNYPAEGLRPVKQKFFATDLLRIVSFEATVVSLVAYDLANGRQISPEDRERMMVAFERIDEAVRYANV